MPLIDAQLKQESGFNPNAESSTGAEGIAQVEPSTWGKHSGSPWNPSDAIPFAVDLDCRYASDVSGHCSAGPVSCMLAAYNDGPHGVEAADGIPDNSQTRDYVKNILAAAGLPSGS